MHPCGRKTSCMDLAYSIVFRMGWQAAAMGAILLMAAPNLLLTLFQIIWRICSNSSSGGDDAYWSEDGSKQPFWGARLHRMRHSLKNAKSWSQKQGDNADCDGEDGCYSHEEEYDGADLVPLAPTSALSILCDGPYGGAAKAAAGDVQNATSALTLQQHRGAHCEGIMGGKYSPAMRLRKAIFFNRPMEMNSEHH